jgi:hypothetical protein
MKKKYSLLICLVVTLQCFSYKIYAEEEFIDISSFLSERTQQYPLQCFKHVFLSTPPRTGSTLVYNVLRFLFENNPHFLWEENALNIVVKRHETNHIRNDVKYVSTIRDPIEACFSHYRVLCSRNNKIMPLEVLDEIIQFQVACINFTDQLLENKIDVLVLKYEDFVDNFDFLFDRIEDSFQIEISDEDKIFLSKALSKKNVRLNVEKFSNFEEFDQFNLFHGAHIDLDEFSEEYKNYVKMEIERKFSKYIDICKKWGYFKN